MTAFFRDLPAPVSPLALAFGVGFTILSSQSKSGLRQ
jgi:hypothetical protein